MIGAISGAVEQAEVVASPLGLFHEDHVLTARACYEVARQVLPLKRWVIYEDVIYRSTAGRTERAIAALVNDGFVLRDVSFAEAAQKSRAIQRYPSQVLGLGPLLEDAYRPERYWELAVT